MRETAGDRATGNQDNGAAEAAFAELRLALIGRELEQIAVLLKRLDDPVVRAAETGTVLPGAVRSASPRGLRDALEPVFEKSFHNSVRKHPREVSDAIYPVMGPAIRASVAAAIREFAESLNQIVEKSASWRAISWRIEARVTGKPFTEILLARSLLYSVEQVFLIHRKSGVLLQHVSAKSAVVRDADMVSGMLTAIQDFVSDSFLESGQKLETIDVGRYKLWIQYGPKALLAGAVSGTAPVELRGVFRSALEKIHETLLAPLDSLNQNDLSVFEPARPYLESCLLGQRAPDRGRRWVPWLVLVLIAAVFGILAFVQIREWRRWDAWVDALEHQPGIIVLRAERHGAGGLIAGFKDPKAPDPSSQLSGYGLDPSDVRFEWQPWMSLNTPFAADRELEQDVEQIQMQTIRFERGSPLLPIAESAMVDNLAAAIERIRRVRPGLRVIITGHTDEVGGPEANAKLSMDRAVNVRQALAAQGVPAELLHIVAAGDAQPLRTGDNEWDRGANRSVSIRVDAGPQPGR